MLIQSHVYYLNCSHFVVLQVFESTYFGFFSVLSFHLRKDLKFCDSSYFPFVRIRMVAQIPQNIVSYKHPVVSQTLGNNRKLETWILFLPSGASSSVSFQRSALTSPSWSCLQLALLDWWASVTTTPATTTHACHFPFSNHSHTVLFPPTSYMVQWCYGLHK